MKVCIPVVSQDGLKSQVNPHFGTSAHYAIYDTELEQLQAFDMGGETCRCGSPALLSMDLDAVICGGIGNGALRKLQLNGIKVYSTDADTVGQALSLLKSGHLGEQCESSCGGGHAHGHACQGHG